jgi:hypothetical protein
MTVGVLDLYKRHARTLRLPGLDANMFQLTEPTFEGIRGCKPSGLDTCGQSQSATNQSQILKSIFISNL